MSITHCVYYSIEWCTPCYQAFSRLMLVEKCNPVKVENNIDILYFYVRFWTKCGLTELNILQQWNQEDIMREGTIPFPFQREYYVHFDLTTNTFPITMYRNLNLYIVPLLGGRICLDSHQHQSKFDCTVRTSPSFNVTNQTTVGGPR